MAAVRQVIKGIRTLCCGYADYVWDPCYRGGKLLSVNFDYYPDRNPVGIRWWVGDSQQDKVVAEHTEWLKGE